jgi:hypothetical protein
VNLTNKKTAAFAVIIYWDSNLNSSYIKGFLKFWLCHGSYLPAQNIESKVSNCGATIAVL